MKYRGNKAQDQWIVEEVFPGRRDGVFLDLAASDGATQNNTVLLDRVFGWQGLCIEPNPVFHAALAHNRRCQISHACVDEGEADVEFFLNGALGGIVADDTDNCLRTRSDQIAAAYDDGRILRLRTRTLASLLEEHAMPRVIDYFSLDVEGAESRVLRGFPFDRWRFLALTIEQPSADLNALLFANGYVFVRNRGDETFYVHQSLPSLPALSLEPFSQLPRKTW